MCSTPELPGPSSNALAGRWSGWRESNPRHQLGRLRCYHCTTPAYPKKPRGASSANWWRELDSNQRRLSQQIYSLPPLATRESLHYTLFSIIPRKRVSRKGRAILHFFHTLSITQTAMWLNWSRQQESNPWPADYKSAALPSELCRQGWRIIAIMDMNSSTN